MGTDPLVVAISRVRDEDDIIESSLRRMLGQVDHVIIGEGGSQDRTREIIDHVANETGRVTVYDDDALNYEQCDVMTEYARRAQLMGAKFAAFYDTDEVWFADGGSIRDVLLELPEHILIATARNLTHCATTEDDESDPDVLHRMGWREAEMLPLMKVACRLRDDLSVGHGNHSAHYGSERHAATVNGVLESRHFPYRTADQFVKRVKIAWPMLRDSGLPESHGAHMWAYGRHLDEFGEEGLRRWFENGHLHTPGRPGMVHDPLPELSSPLSFPGVAAAPSASASGSG